MEALEEPASVTKARQLAGRPAAREVVPSDPSQSARWHQHGVPSPYSRWNYHPEYEVHLIRSGTGRYVVGDRIDVFTAGQLVLVGSNLPHHWISDLEPGESIPDRDVVFQFHPDWIGRCRAILPELAGLEPLLAASARGIEFTGRSAAAGAVELEAIGTTTGPARLRHIFGLFDILSHAAPAERHPLAKAWLPPVDDPDAADIIDRAFGYIFDNITGSIRLTEAARAVAMSESAFSRFFKRVSGQTFSDTVRKLRLAHAGKLLRETALPVSVVYQRVGYANLSNFNRQFRTQHGVTPTQFRRAVTRGGSKVPVVDR